jgi:hypothetical protein
MNCCVGLVSGMSGRLAINRSIPPGKLAKIPSSVTKLVFVGSEESYCCRTVVGSSELVGV